ncbi:hypothetical protein [Herbiconiux sp. A18JL235]|uniref:PilZ domain-containing protein n=1 Tax=Herbiconiux sp. A18JL235 TaxID=3152363 RepID=A0AB39BLV8_9MICO
MATSSLSEPRSLPTAYPVPLRLDRRDAPHSYTLKNIGDEPLRGISFSLLGPGLMRATPPVLLQPGERLRLRIRGTGLSVGTVLVVRWFRPGGDEYLWRISF